MELGVRLLGALEILLAWLSIPIYYFLSFRKPQYLPPIKSNLLSLSAKTIAYKIRNRVIKCEDTVKAFIDRCREVNPLINAIVEERFIDALEEARKVDKLLEDKNCDLKKIEKDYPFLGVPFTVKESCGLLGLSQSVGCKPRKGVIACKDGEAVRRMREAGAIPIAVTNTPELCLSWETNNLVTGATCNPYNIYRTPGGSSGGEAAIIAAAGSVIGVGSDIAGSIRLPSMFCGIFGHKPTPGYISIEGHFPISSDNNFQRYLVVGPMARYAEDLRPLLKIMAGEKGKYLNLDKEVKISDIEINFKDDAGFSIIAIPVEKEIKHALHNVVQYLQLHHGCKINMPELEELADSVEISASVFFGMNGIPDLLQLSSSKNGRPNLYMEMMKSVFGSSEFSIHGLLFMFINEHNSFIPKKRYGEYFHQNKKLKEKINSLLGENGVFLYPTYPIPAFHHNEFVMKTAGVMYTVIINTLELPSTHVPLGLNSKGLPIGIQVIAAEGQDRLCLAVAEALEEKFGGWVPPPCF